MVDYQLTHGSILKFLPPISSHKNLHPSIDTDNEDNAINHTDIAKSTTPLAPFPVAATLFPTPFPRELFKEATTTLQGLYQKLYRCVASDEAWLRGVLEDVVEHDEMVGGLLEVLDLVRKEGEGEKEENGERGEKPDEEQKVRMAIWRSDYMVEVNDLLEGKKEDEDRGETGCIARDKSKRLGLKQIEFNTIACAGGMHGNIVSDMHRFLSRTGEYELRVNGQQGQQIKEEAMPRNNTTSMIARGLREAHHLYGNSRHQGVQGTCILFVVQDRNLNIADERSIEYELWNCEPPLPNFRIIFGEDVLKHTSLSEDRQLLYHPPIRPNQTWEVSVVYSRSAHDDFEYDEAGFFARLQLEKRRAINCPDILTQLTGLKKVQQALTEDETLERWLRPEEVATIRETFGTMHSLKTLKAGKDDSSMNKVEESLDKYFLKPNREGGGHNVFGRDIQDCLNNMSEEEWGSYILMEKVKAPRVQNILMSHKGIYRGPVVSELGIFSACVRCSTSEQHESDFLVEAGTAWSLKTKAASVDEMSVVKGYGCFDSPLLVDSEAFMSIAEVA